MEDKILALIDADSLCYSSSKETIEESITIIREKINNILIQTKCDYFSLFISQGRYFRHDIADTYKIGRKDHPTKLRFIKTLKSFLQEEYKANWMNGIEADDYLAWIYKQDIVFEVEEEKIKFKKVICAIDKDIIQNIPGVHFNYTYKPEDKENPESIIKGYWVTTTPEESEFNFIKQVLTGDTSDSVITPFPDSAGEWFVLNKMDFTDLVKAYMFGLRYKTFTGKDKFVAGYGPIKGIYELNKNLKLLKLLDTPEDYEREKLPIPEIPTILKTKDYIQQQIDYKGLF